jgi:hypothetical protein
MVSAGGSPPPANPWVSVVPGLVCKPVVTTADALCALVAVPVEEFAFFFHDSGRPLARHQSTSQKPYAATQQEESAFSPCEEA